MKAKTPPPPKDEQDNGTAVTDSGPGLDLAGRPAASTTTPALQSADADAREEDGQAD